MFLKNLAVVTFFLMVACGLMLPSDGNHGILSPKSLSFVAATASWILYSLSLYRYSLPQLGIYALSFLIVTFLLLWTLLGLFYGETPFSSQFDQLKIFVTTLLTVIMALFYLSTRTFSPQSLIVCALYSNFAYSSLKVVAATLHLLRIVDIVTFIRTTGFRLMSMDIHGGMVRLQTSVDIATPFLLLFLLQHRILGLALPRGFPSLALAIALLSVLLSFSRYLMFVSGCALLCHWLMLTPMRQLGGILVAATALALTTTLVGGDAIYKIVERRLFSTDNYYSDRTRSEQIAAMEEEVVHHPLLGKGVGAFAPRCIRDNQLPYSYEVQWVAFTMQFGLLGVTLLALTLLLIGWGYMTPPHTLVKGSFLAMYLLWLLSGFTNPFLISLTSGILYSLFWAGSLSLNHPRPHSHS